MQKRSLAAMTLAAALVSASAAQAAPFVQDYWVEPGKVEVIPLKLEGGEVRLVIVEGDNPRLEYCLADPEGAIVHCEFGYMQIEVRIPEGQTEYMLYVENMDQISGNFRVIMV